MIGIYQKVKNNEDQEEHLEDEVEDIRKRRIRIRRMIRIYQKEKDNEDQEEHLQDEVEDQEKKDQD